MRANLLANAIAKDIAVQPLLRPLRSIASAHAAPNCAAYQYDPRLREQDTQVPQCGGTAHRAMWRECVAARKNRKPCHPRSASCLRFSWRARGPRGQRFRSGGAGIKLWGSFGARRSKPLAAGSALTDSLPFSRARGEPRRHRSWSRRWRAATRIFFSVFRQRRLELRGRPRRQPDRALAGYSPR